MSIGYSSAYCSACHLTLGDHPRSVRELHIRCFHLSRITLIHRVAVADINGSQICFRRSCGYKGDQNHYLVRNLKQLLAHDLMQIQY